MTEIPFIGRADARDAFDSLLSPSARQNVLYVEAPGGLGKTRLLRELIADVVRREVWAARPDQTAPDPLIDFFELRNRSTISELLIFHSKAYHIS